MLDTLYGGSKLLRGEDIVVSDKVTIKHPKLYEIDDLGEHKYYGMVSILSGSPADYKVALFDAGIYYDEISDFDFFCLMCSQLKKEDTEILLGDIDLSNLVAMSNKENGNIVLCDSHGEIIIDEGIYKILSHVIRTLHGLKKNSRKPANPRTRDYAIKRERKQIERAKKNKENKPILEPLVIAMVNSPHFKYDYSTVWDLPIYQFNSSVESIQKHKNYDQIMQGIYAGTISSKDIDLEKISYLR